MLVLGHRLGLLHLFPGRNSLDFVVVMMIWHRLTKRLIAGTIDEMLNLSDDMDRCIQVDGQHP